MLNHTPARAPWTAEPIPDAARSDLQLDDTDRFWIVDTGGAAEVLATIHETSEQQGSANARVMAAAPELLQACRDVVALYDGVMDLVSPGVAEKLARAKAAIAKADAREPSTSDAAAGSAT